jgi:hypothetical protein
MESGIYQMPFPGFPVLSRSKDAPPDLQQGARGAFRDPYSPGAVALIGASLGQRA